ncbi:DUF6087 family protein (plasmid) [Streptomyces sp. NBC_01294]|nr:DUF6087 family protein [Streptomyces sp. NBC_01294]
MDADAALAAYNKRRRPPMDIHRRHRPVNGGSTHLRPGETRVLEEWSVFAYEPVGTAPNLAAAQEWLHELQIRNGPAA